VSATQEIELQVTCRWCGTTTPVGVICESCGSPMDVLDRCRYCKNLSYDAVCARCQDILVRLWRIAQESPDSRFLFADVL
jgi:hypothetical protein